MVGAARTVDIKLDSGMSTSPPSKRLINIQFIPYRSPNDLILTTPISRDY